MFLMTGDKMPLKEIDKATPGKHRPQAYCKKLGIKKTTWHAAGSIRYCSGAVGTDIDTVRQLLKHSSVRRRRVPRFEKEDLGDELITSYRSNYHIIKQERAHPLAMY